MSFLSLLLLASVAQATYWINQAPLNSQYNALQSCAMSQVSTIIRGMSSGCGINPKTSYTSFDCFCTSSKQQLQWTLGQDVMNACSTDPGGDATASLQVTSAIQLYNSYCQLPLMDAASASINPTPTASTLATSASVPTASPATTSASPGGSVGVAGAVNTSPAQTGVPATSSHSSRLSTGAIVGIAIGVSTFVVLAILLIAILFFVRRQKTATPETREKRDSDHQNFFIPMYLDNRQREGRSRSNNTTSTHRANSRSTNPALGRTGSSASHGHRSTTNEAMSPQELVSPTSPANALTRSDTAWNGRTTVPMPSRREERRQTPIAELPREGTERVELEGDLVTVEKALPPTPEELEGQPRTWI